ncbi:hypothetical protein [Actinobacillus capsulatus]|nr:hypothetical protein [Actinobacillus capsulatus]
MTALTTVVNYLTALDKGDIPTACYQSISRYSLLNFLAKSSNFA